MPVFEPDSYRGGAPSIERFQSKSSVRFALYVIFYKNVIKQHIKIDLLRISFVDEYINTIFIKRQYYFTKKAIPFAHKFFKKSFVFCFIVYIVQNSTIFLHILHNILTILRYFIRHTERPNVYFLLHFNKFDMQKEKKTNL